jgi:putative lipase involved disintegration of autophagic bodies
MKINNTFYKLIYDLAIMSNNVYTYINQSNWIDLPNYTVKDITNDNNTIKSFIFYNKEISVISFKGTTTIIGLQEEQQENVIKEQEQQVLSSAFADKFNDNLYFSCCFYKQSNLFNDLHCECDKGTFNCCKSCYQNSTSFSLNYINIAQDIIEKIKKDIDIDFRNVIFLPKLRWHSSNTVATEADIFKFFSNFSFDSK